MNLFDLHCDTAYEIYIKNEEFSDNSLHISEKKTKYLDKHIQVFAVWSDCALDNRAASKQFYAVYERFIPKAEQSGYTMLKSGNDVKNRNRGFILGVEGARILNLDPDEIYKLYDIGVRILTLQWKGRDCIGGAFDTDARLTPFGKETVKAAFSLGMTVDVSHCSARETEDVLDLAEEAGKPIIASHSNAYSVCPHTRNLSDDSIKRISALGGLIGLSFVPGHLNISGEANTDDFIKHIKYIIGLGCEKALAFGSDFDGVGKLPSGIENITSMNEVYDKIIKSGIGKKITECMFFENAYKYFEKNM